MPETNEILISPEVKALLFLLSGTVFLNLVFSTWFWLRYRSTLYRNLMLIWIAQFATMMTHGLLREYPVLLTSLLAVTCLPGTWSLADLLMRLIGRKARLAPFAVIAATGAVISYLISLINPPFVIRTIPTVFGYCVPIFYGLYHVVRNWRVDFTPAQKGLILSIVVQVIHLMDYPFLANNPELFVFGSTVNIMIVFCQAIFGPMTVVELGMAETAKLKREQELLKKDLEVTLAVQSFLLPKAPDIRSPCVSIASYYQPAIQAGGDWWWHDETPDGRAHIIVGDVTGHGPDSAMISALVASSYQTLLNLRPQSSVVEILSALNSSLLSACEERYFMTMTVIDYDPKKSLFHWATAAAPPFLLLSKEGKVRTISGDGNQLGSQDFACREGVERLDQGERLLIFTDGITDATIPGGTKLGLRRWVQLVEETRALPLFQSRDALVERAVGISTVTDRADDVTLVIVEPAPPA